MEKIAFTMQLKRGCEEEYRRRHDALWPELAELLRASGVRDYSIYLDRPTGTLFAVLWRSNDHQMDALPQNAIMQRWWAEMAPLMQTHPDGRPVATALPCVFHLE